MPGPMDPRHDYPGYVPGQKRRPPWLAIALGIAVVIIVVLSAVLITQFKNDPADEPAVAAPTPTSEVRSAPPQGTGTTEQSMTCEGYTANVDPGSQPGWHATVNRLGLAYAAPPDWSVAACGVRMGWAKPCPQGQCVVREIGAPATVANPACPKQNIAMAGVASSKNPDIGAALDEELATVPAIYEQNGQVPKVEYTPVRDFTIGDHPAVQRVATVTGIATDDCNGPTALHSMVVTTVPNVEGSVVFLISLREGVNATPKPDVINKMVDTLRSPA
ncbi:hypothetical protein [Mycolicibacterium sp. XJ1819]